MFLLYEVRQVIDMNVEQERAKNLVLGTPIVSNNPGPVLPLTLTLCFLSLECEVRSSREAFAFVLPCIIIVS